MWCGFSTMTYEQQEHHLSQCTLHQKLYGCICLWVCIRKKQGTLLYSYMVQVSVSFIQCDYALHSHHDSPFLYQ